MSRNCEEPGCKKTGKYLYEGKLVCKFHSCRCKDPFQNLHGGCFIHQKKL